MHCASGVKGKCAERSLQCMLKSTNGKDGKIYGRIGVRMRQEYKHVHNYSVSFYWLALSAIPDDEIWVKIGGGGDEWFPSGQLQTLHKTPWNLSLALEPGLKNECYNYTCIYISTSCDYQLTWNFLVKLNYKKRICSIFFGDPDVHIIYCQLRKSGNHGLHKQQAT